MAELDIQEGRPAAAVARLTPLLDQAGLEECDVTALLPVLAAALPDLGRVDEASKLVAQALARARREGLRIFLVEALRVQAQVALRQEQWAEVECSLEEGMAVARAIPYPYAEARILRLDSQRHAALGDRTAAAERLEAALTIFRRLGAATDVACVEGARAALNREWTAEDAGREGRGKDRTGLTTTTDR